MWECVSYNHAVLKFHTSFQSNYEYWLYLKYWHASYYPRGFAFFIHNRIKQYHTHFLYTKNIYEKEVSDNFSL